jgi:hypothetical protein
VSPSGHRPGVSPRSAERTHAGDYRGGDECDDYVCGVSVEVLAAVLMAGIAVSSPARRKPGVSWSTA